MLFLLFDDLFNLFGGPFGLVLGCLFFFVDEFLEGAYFFVCLGFFLFLWGLVVCF